MGDNISQIFRQTNIQFDLYRVQEPLPDYLQRVARKVERYDSEFELMPWSKRALIAKWKFAGYLARCEDGR